MTTDDMNILLSIGRVRPSVDMILLGRRIAILLHFTTALSQVPYDYETLNLLRSS